MTARYGFATVASAGITFLLFFVMHHLIATDLRGDQKRIRSEPIEIVRPERESDVQTKRRLPRQAQLDEQPKPPPLQISSTTRPKLELAAIPVSFDASIALAGGPALGPAPSDADVTPIVRVLPQYPIRARERGIEGWVLVEFTISKTGRVTDVTVIDADPLRIFDRAAIRSVKRWKYNPKIENGKPVERHGVRAVISFELTDE